MPRFRAKPAPAITHAMICFACVVLLSLPGCSRKFWRRQADDDAYRAVSEKQTDFRWQLPRMDLTPDARSRFYDPHDPDCAPLPPDDAAAHQFMLCADGKEGYKNWHKFGDSFSVENPHWLEPYDALFTTASPVDSHAEVKIPEVSLQEAVDLTYIHSREYQTAIEDVFLSALALTLQRYELNHKFVIGPGAGGNANGVGGALFGGGVNRNSAAGNRNTADTASISNGVGFSRLLPVGTTVAMNIINTITWNTATGSGTATRLAWEITQPFMNGAGRKVVMEALTQAERSLLYEVRNLARFRQVLFTNVSSDYLSILEQIQNIQNLENNIRQLQIQIDAAKAFDDKTPNRVTVANVRLPEGFELPASLRSFLTWDKKYQTLTWAGDMSEEQKEELLGYSDDPDYQESVQELVGYRELDVLTLAVAQLVTRRNRSENTLADARRQLADLLDDFKLRLGLPPNVLLTTDTSLLKPFELIDPLLIKIESDLDSLAQSKGVLLIGGVAESGSAEGMAAIRSYVEALTKLKDQIEKEGFPSVEAGFGPIDEILKGQETATTSTGERRIDGAEERQRVVYDLGRDRQRFSLTRRSFRKIDEQLTLLTDLLSAETADELLLKLDTDSSGGVSADELPVGWEELSQAKMPDEEQQLSAAELLLVVRKTAIVLREELEKNVQGLQGVQVGLRVDAIALNDFKLPGRIDTPDIEEVIRIGLENRHDLMNARAAVMDSRRAVEVAANGLLSVMDFSASGSLDPDGGRNDGVDLSLNFKAPLDQVEERNAYRQALVEYQRQRRAYIQLEDEIKRDIRLRWRQLEVSRQRLEIDRQTIRNAALQYDSAALNANGAGENNSLNLLNALDAVLNAQNSLVSDWITYETNRLNIFRDMGIMALDSDGLWEDDFYQRSNDTPLPNDDFGLNSNDLPELTVPTSELTPQPAPILPPSQENPNE